MIRRYSNFFARVSWFREGIYGATVNLIICGSGLACLFWYSASASLSNEQVALVPGVLLIYFVPLLLIGFASGALSYQLHIGKVVMIIAMLLGSSIGFLAATAFLLPILETHNGIYQQGLPLFRNAVWVALATTLVGILAAIGMIVLAGSIRKIVKRTG